MISEVLSGARRWAVVEADCRSVLPQIEGASFDAVISDWPYGVEIAAWDKAAPYDLLPEFLRISRGPVVLFGAATRLVADARFLDPAPDRTLIWAPGFTNSHTQANGIFYRYHPVYCWRLPKKHDGPCHDVLRHNAGSVRVGWNHPCTKPVDLMRDLCGFAPAGAAILDPFVGSGTTIVAGLQRGQRVAGIELDPAHAATARERATAEERGHSLAAERAGQKTLWSAL